jgi:Reverse transcriptase (RNA-dependent DNA polymerase)
VKFDGRHKARLVAGGNHTESTKEDIYSGVVGIEAVRIGLIHAKLNGLMVGLRDIGNAFLYGQTKEKVYIKAGVKFGELAGETLILNKGLYGLRSFSARFHEHLSEKLQKMGYKPSKADADLWYKDCGEQYEYITFYVDDILNFSKDPMAVI